MEDQKVDTKIILRLTSKENDEMCIVHFDDIAAIMKDGDYTVLYMKAGPTRLWVKEPPADIWLAITSIGKDRP